MEHVLTFYWKYFVKHIGSLKLSKPFSFQLISLIEKHCRFLLHTKIACDLRVFRDFVLRSFVKVQGHRKKKFITRVCFISFLCRTIGGFYFTKILLEIVSSIQGQVCKLKVIVWNNAWFLFWPYPITEKWFKAKHLTQRLLVVYKCVLILRFGNLCKFKVTVRKKCIHFLLIQKYLR